MRVIIRLEGDTENTECDYAVLNIDNELLDQLAELARVVLAIGILLPDLYKIDVWGNNLLLCYPYSLALALEEQHPLPAGESDDWDICLYPADFKIPQDCRESPLDCRLTEVTWTPDCNSVEEIDFQFSTVPDHEMGTVRTVPCNLATLRQWNEEQA